MFLTIKRSIISSIAIGQGLFLIVLLIFAALALVDHFASTSIIADQATNHGEMTGRDLVLSVIVAPAIESIIMFAIYLLLKMLKIYTPTRFCVLVCLGAFLAHASRGFFSMFAVFAFIVFSKLFIINERKHGSDVGLLTAFLAHVSNNFSVLLVSRAVL